MKKALLVPIVALTLVGSTLIAVMPAQATSDSGNSRTTLMARISQRFGLDQSEVEKVADEVQTERHQQMQQQLEERLNTAVSKGNLTPAQKDAIVKKYAELAAQRDSLQAQFQTLTPPERKAAREKARADLEAWAKENGIDMKFFMVMKHGWRHQP